MRFEVYLDRSDEYRWRLRSGSNKVAASGEAFASNAERATTVAPLRHLRACTAYPSPAVGEDLSDEATPRRPVIVLYDADCGFCRWAMAWAIRRDDRGALVAVPIQSPLGGELLADVIPSDRLRRAHVVRDDGPRSSGGGAVADVLSVLGSTQTLGALARSLPGPTALLYGLVAARRESFGRLVGATARRRADELLAAASVSTAAELTAASRWRASDL